ncbi:MAG: rhomboid family intramembrane serine protease [Planctomycetota bacterium]|nr:rhomboid family intramembrane serine protease [Planctomycetota bacterium]
MEARWEDPPEYRGGGGPQFAMPGLTPMVKNVIFVNAAVFLVQLLLGFPSTMSAKLWIEDAFSINPVLWTSWFPFVPVWQLLTYGFLHDGILHVLYNMLFLFFLGTMLEGTVGPRRFLVFYLVAVTLSGAAQLALGLVMGQSALVLGASGGVLAVVCAMATLRPETRIIFIVFPLTLKTLAIIIVGIDAIGLITMVQGQHTGVASLAHLTGAAFGFLAVRKGWIWRDPVAGLERVRERNIAEQAATDQERLDELLRRIHREGIGSLSAREKAFLKRMSQSR